MDAKTKGLITAIFGNCELTLRCAKCKQDFVTKSVATMTDMDEAALNALGMSLFPTVSTHVCEAAKK